MIEDVEKDFREFQQATPLEVPSGLEQRILQTVRRDLNVVLWKFFTKLALVQVLAGGATLLVCPQFGLGPLGGGAGIMHIVMQYGTVACALFCGSIFLGSSAIGSLFVFGWGERQYLYKGRFWIFGVLGVASVCALMLASAVNFRSLHVWHHLEFALIWAVGGAVLAQLLFQIGHKIREQLELGFSG